MAAVRVGDHYYSGPSCTVCHSRELRVGGSRYRNSFRTLWQGDVSSLL